MSLLPKTVSARDIQRNYRKIFDEAKKTGEPIVVMHNNQPDVAIIDIKALEKMIVKLEEVDALEAVNIMEKEKRAGTLKKLNSLRDLIE